MTRVGCHLCEQAEQTVRAVLADAGRAGGLRVLDVDGDLGAHAPKRAEWSELVPIVLIDDAVHAVVRVDPERLRKALVGSKRRWLW